MPYYSLRNFWSEQDYERKGKYTDRNNIIFLSKNRNNTSPDLKVTVLTDRFHEEYHTFEIFENKIKTVPSQRVLDLERRNFPS